MEHFIKLRNNEFITLVESFGKDYVTTFLFNHFYHCLTNLQEFNNLILNIISLRTPNAIKEGTEQEPELKSEPEPIQLNEFPSVIISKISSYLLFKNLKSFETCNRSIFMETRSPISLDKLPNKYATKLIQYIRNNIYHDLNLKLICIITLSQTMIKLNTFIQYSLNNMPFWNNLESLKISDYVGWEWWLCSDQSGMNNSTMIKYIKWKHLSMEHWIDLHSNNYSYKKQMFLLNDKLYSLLFGYEITSKKPTYINININKNNINCLPSFQNITANALITEPTSNSTHQSTNGPACEPTHAPVTTHGESSITEATCKSPYYLNINSWL